MPLHVSGSLDGLLSLLAPCFSQPTFQSFRALAVGFIARVGEHTVCGMWQAVRLAGRVHHSHAHDFFARRRWDPDRLGLVALDFLVTVPAKDGAICVAVDDTLFGRSGPKVYGAHYLHDGPQLGRAGAPAGATASWSSDSWSACRALTAAASACQSCFGSFVPETSSTPTAARSLSWRASWSICSSLDSPPARCNCCLTARVQPRRGVMCPTASRSPRPCAPTPRCLA